MQLKKEKPKIKDSGYDGCVGCTGDSCRQGRRRYRRLFNGAFDRKVITPVDIVAPIKEIYTHYGYKTKILSCCRFPRGCREYAAAGTDMITLGKDFITMLYGIRTRQRMLGFIKDWTGSFGSRTWPKE